MRTTSFITIVAIFVTCLTFQKTGSDADRRIHRQQQQQQQQQQITSNNSNNNIHTGDSDPSIDVQVAMAIADGTERLEKEEENDNDVKDDDVIMTSVLTPEAQAIHGKLFEYEIPGFDGKGRRISTYQIYAGDSQVLPNWLIWNVSTSRLEGIPTHDVIGMKYPMLIVAQLDDSDSTDYTDGSRSNKIIGHFSIIVNQMVYGVEKGINEDHTNSTNTDGNSTANWTQNLVSKSTVECTKAGSSVTKAIVVIDTDLTDVSPSQKIHLVKQLAKQLEIDPFSVIVRSVTDLELMANSALVAGRGNVEKGKSTVETMITEKSEDKRTGVSLNDTDGATPGGLHRLEISSPVSYLSLQWVVGCGDVQAQHMDILRSLEKAASNGRLSLSLGGLGVMAWYVINNKPRRSKRSFPLRLKHGQVRSKHFNVDFHPDRAIDIYAASGDGYEFSDTQTKTPAMSIPIPVTISTTRSKSLKSSKKQKTKKLKTTLPNTLPPIEVHVGRPFIYDLSHETIFANGAKDYVISTDNSNSLPPNFWIKINTTSPKLYGFPLEDAEGKHEFKISTMTRNGVAIMYLQMIVLNEDSMSRPNHQFCMTIEEGYERFIYDVESRIDVATKLARAFRSDNPEEMTVLGISDGSVVYTWYNNTLPQEHCDEDDLLYLMNNFVDSNGDINDDFRKTLLPYKLINASVSTFGPCSNIPPRPSIRDEKTADARVTKDRISSNKLFYMIVGLIVIAAIILVIIFVAVLLLCRHRRKQKHEKQKQLFKSGIPSKGVPVIFAEELQAAEKEEDRKSQRGDERLPDTARSTLRSRKGSDDGNLNHDKKGVLPPEYQLLRPGNRDAALKNDMVPILEGFTKNPLYNNEDIAFLDPKDLSDDNHNIDSYKAVNFKRGDPRVRHENRKNQQIIVSDID